VALLSLGTRLQECLKAANELAGCGVSVTVCRCALRQAARCCPDRASGARARGADHRRGGCIGGFASHVLHHSPLPACSRTASRCGRWCCPTASSTTTRPPCNMTRPVSTLARSSKGDGGARSRDEHHGNGLSRFPSRFHRLTRLVEDGRQAAPRYDARRRGLAESAPRRRRSPSPASSIAASAASTSRARCSPRTRRSNAAARHPYVSRGGVKLAMRSTISPSIPPTPSRSTSRLDRRLHRRAAAARRRQGLRRRCRARPARLAAAPGCTRRRPRALQRTPLTRDEIRRRRPSSSADASSSASRRCCGGARARRAGGRAHRSHQAAIRVGKGRVGQGGVVRDSALHAEVCGRIEAWLAARAGWSVLGVTESPIAARGQCRVPHRGATRAMSASSS